MPPVSVPEGRLSRLQKLAGLGAAAWSEDNLVAVAGSLTVPIYGAADVAGPRGYAVVQPRVGAADTMRVLGQAWQDSSQLASLFLSDQAACSRAQATEGTCAVAWSPAGLAADGGCFLSALTTTGCVHVFGLAINSASSAWQPVLDASVLLRRTVETDNWRVRRAASPSLPLSSRPPVPSTYRVRRLVLQVVGEAATLADPPLRLRGGGVGVAHRRDSVRCWDRQPHGVLRLRGGGAADGLAPRKRVRGEAVANSAAAEASAGHGGGVEPHTGGSEAAAGPVDAGEATVAGAGARAQGQRSYSGPPSHGSHVARPKRSHP